jgi:plastocyanin
VGELKRFLLVLAVGGVFACASVAIAAPRQIAIDDNFFAPDNPPARSLQTGPSFRWVSAPSSDRLHNVRQDFKLFYSGALTTDPIDFSISASAGSYHYYCELHGSTTAGMDGVVKVRPTSSLAPTGAPFTVKWALLGTNTGDRFDVRFRRGTSGTFTPWRTDTSTRSGVFGQNGQPVQVAPGRTYQFQARSQLGPSRQSGWSPTLTVHT